MIWIYRIVFFPLLLSLLPYYLWRMWRRGGYRKGLLHRFGWIQDVPLKQEACRRIWFQAVSVGEVLALGPLMKRLTECAGIDILLTTTTSTGYTLARKLYASDRKVTIAVFPLDFWLFRWWAWNRVQPDLTVLMEGELWPEHIHQARQRRVPLILINGRISDRSFERFLRFKSLSRRLLKRMTLVLTASEQDQERLLALGAAPEKTHCVGNLKFDVSIDTALDEQAVKALRQQLGFYGMEGKEPLVILAASTWPGEEAMMLNAFECTLASGIDCRLLIVPRHAERSKEIQSLLRAQSRPWHLRSRSKVVSSPVMIHLADTTGELKRLTQAAHVAFIGKSMPPHEGGQTPIEAAARGVPLFYGPSMGNFRRICKSLEKAKIAEEVTTTEALTAKLIEYLKNPKRCHTISIAARQWFRYNQGATERTLTFLKKWL